MAAKKGQGFAKNSHIRTAVIAVGAIVIVVLLVLFGPSKNPTGALGATGNTHSYIECLKEGYVVDEEPLKGDREVFGKIHTVRQYDYDKIAACRKENWKPKYFRRSDVYSEGTGTSTGVSGTKMREEDVGGERIYSRERTTQHDTGNGAGWYYGK